VHFRKSDVIHIDDVFFNKLYPFIDASSGGTIDGVVAAADRVLTIATDKTKQNHSRPHGRFRRCLGHGLYPRCKICRNGAKSLMK
jgi:hypothetical protein